MLLEEAMIIGDELNGGTITEEELNTGTSEEEGGGSSADDVGSGTSLNFSRHSGLAWQAIRDFCSSKELFIEIAATWSSALKEFISPSPQATKIPAIDTIVIIPNNIFWFIKNLFADNQSPHCIVYSRFLEIYTKVMSKEMFSKKLLFLLVFFVKKKT